MMEGLSIQYRWGPGPHPQARERGFVGGQQRAAAIVSCDGGACDVERAAGRLQHPRYLRGLEWPAGALGYVAALCEVGADLAQRALPPTAGLAQPAGERHNIGPGLGERFATAELAL